MLAGGQHAPLEPPQDCVGFVIFQIDLDLFTDVLQQALVIIGNIVRGGHQNRARALAHDMFNRGGQFCRVARFMHQPRGHRVHRHAIKSGGIGALRQGPAPRLDHRFQPRRSIRAGARQHQAD